MTKTDPKTGAILVDNLFFLRVILVDNLEIPSMEVINNAMQSGERALMLAEFKLSPNSYLSELTTSPVRSLSDSN